MVQLIETSRALARAMTSVRSYDNVIIASRRMASDDRQSEICSPLPFARCAAPNVTDPGEVTASVIIVGSSRDLSSDPVHCHRDEITP
jgi:hypothetical protein